MKRSPVLSAFGFNFRKRREARQLTQEALAEKSGLHSTYVSGIKRGAAGLNNMTHRLWIVRW